MDEILGVMDALGACRKTAVLAGDAADNLCAAQQQGSSPAAPAAAAATGGVSLPSNRSNTPNSSNFDCSSTAQPAASQHLHKQQQQTPPNSLSGQQQEQHSNQQQQQPSPAVSPRGSSPLGRHTRASMLSSKVAAGQAPVVAVKPAVFSFDAAHPVLADKHYLRTKEQDR
jgi:hypothetical protein